MRLVSSRPRGALAALSTSLLLACGSPASPAPGPGASPAPDASAIRLAPDRPLPDAGQELAIPSAAPEPADGAASAALGGLRERRRVEARPILPGSATTASAPSAEAAAVAAPALRGRAGAGGPEVPFALVHTSVRAQVSGDVARVEVTQYYANPSPDRLEAIYTFPLPPNAAVTDMLFRIGNRVVLSEVHRREEARRTYEAARAEGKTAALTEQERPNVFTQSVANIPPGATVAVVLRYVHEVPLDDGRYLFHFPTTIGPRYVPGAPLSESSGPGFSPDTDRVPDASRVTPPVVAPGAPAPHDVDIVVRLVPGDAFEDVAATSHRVETGLDEGGARVVALAQDDCRPDKDFALTWRAAGTAPGAHALVQRERGGDYLLLFLQPPAQVAAAQVRPKELVFLLDKSGSMSGPPMERAKALVARALKASGPDDTFQIIAFDGAAQSMTQGSLPATPANVARGLAWLEQLSGGGGTEMLRGIEAALAQPADPRRLRMVVFCTDGFIGNEAEIIQAVARLRGPARVFGFGIGGSVNRYLVEGVARAGRGAAEIVDLKESPEAAVQRLFRRLDRPVLTELEASFEGAEVKDLLPDRLPDLFAGQPLVLAGRLEGAAPHHVLLRGRLGQEPWSARIPVTAGPASGGAPVAGTLWARRRIDALLDASPVAPDPEVVEQVVATALRFRLVTRYTSLVAVERELRVDPSLRLRQAVVPGLLPEEVSHEGIFGPATSVEVLPARVKPGDPELRVDAPPDAAAVQVTLPFEQAPHDALRDPARGDWVLRFLVPPTWPDGSYLARVVVVRADGRREERTSPIRVDTTPAALAILSAPSSVRPGEELRLRVKPALPASRLPALAEQAGGLASALKGAMEVKEVLVRAPWGEVVRARMVGPLGAYTAVLHVPEDATPGPAGLEVVASDAAGNVTRRGVELRVTAPGEARGGTRSVLALALLVAGVAGAAALLAVGFLAMVRRRRGPEPLSRLLLAGSLADMQRAHPRHPAWARGGEL